MSLRRTRYQNPDESYGAVVAGLSLEQNLKICSLALGYSYFSDRATLSASYRNQCRELAGEYFQLTEKLFSMENGVAQGKYLTMCVHRRKGKPVISIRSADCGQVDHLINMASLCFYDLCSQQGKSNKSESWLEITEKLLRYLGSSRRLHSFRVDAGPNPTKSQILARKSQVAEDRRFRLLLESI